MTFKEAKALRAANPDCLCDGAKHVQCDHCTANEAIFAHRDRLAGMKAGLVAYRAKVASGEIAPPDSKNRPTRRVVRCESSTVRAPQIAVTVYPHGEIGFKTVGGSRVEYKLPVAVAYQYACNYMVLRAHSLERKYRKAGATRAEARKRARKEVGL